MAQRPQLVAPTEALAPEEQQAAFILPEGFEIQLVVSDPQIGQPMNLSFDAQGRLWVTHSVEYPYPAQGEGVQPRARFAGVGKHPPRDRLTVIETIGPDGRATELRHFAEGLNIPIGNTPLGDGHTALVYSIPAIFRCTDSDGDGRADTREELYGRFGNIDTHGMSSSFTPWIDGWIYGCHGFSNHSVIRDGSGQTTQMTSGNTYRFRADGSRFEQFTFGQVNPFGMTFDPLGNLYDADCHSMPVYMLLRGASYPHFGKQPEPLGFGPKMIDHNHQSTGICGIAYYDAEHFPADYHDNLFICNPVTGRVHRDKLKQSGSTYQVDTQPDFIRSKDPWFRPVDVQLGPDGALYIADFYNAVIGHYEVPLGHPKRDRTHGRVWRVVYRGADKPAGSPRESDLTKLEAADLVDRLGNTNLLIRTLATNRLVEQYSDDAVPLVRKAWTGGASPAARAHGLWVIERLAGLSDNELALALSDPERIVRVHVVKALAERPKWAANTFALVRRALDDEDAFVRRAAADALERHPHPENVAPLLKAWASALPEDTHLIHTIKLTLRTHFETPASGAPLAEMPFANEALDRLIVVAAASRGAAATTFLLRHAQPGQLDAATLSRVVPQVGRNGDAAQIARLVELAQAEYPEAPVRQFELLRLLTRALAQRGQSPATNESSRAWFATLVPPLLEKLSQSGDIWTHAPLPPPHDPKSPWGVRRRACADGKTVSLIDSIVGGEPRTGIYRSRPFQLPESLSFWMCGHNGPPGQDSPPLNHVRLRLLESDTPIVRAVPPRNDVAQHYTWDLSEHAGQWGVFEIVDAHRGKAYAWLGVGRFDPPLLRVPRNGDDDWREAALALIGQFEMRSEAPRLENLAADRRLPESLRLVAAENAVALGAAMPPVFAEVLADARVRIADRAAAAAALGHIDTEPARQHLVETLAQAPAEIQRTIALALCATPPGANQLLAAIRQGKASARLLQDREIADRFARVADDTRQKQATELTAGLPSVETRLLELIAQRRKAFNPATASAAQGKQVFAKRCAICHQVAGEGKTIGPQLDGVGLRGPARLLEDLLDPNRNVDANFRTTTVITTRGQVLSGLLRRQEGQVLVLADQQGKEFEVSTKDVDETQLSALSLMPSNLAADLPPEELHDLLAYLLSLTTKPTE